MQKTLKTGDTIYVPVRVVNVGKDHLEFTVPAGKVKLTTQDYEAETCAHGGHEPVIIILDGIPTEICLDPSEG